MTNTPAHSPVVVIRVNPADRALLEAARSIEGAPTLSGYMRALALARAEAVIQTLRVDA